MTRSAATMSDEQMSREEAVRELQSIVDTCYVKNCKACQATLVAIAALGGGWLPIESAPKDGAGILGWNRWDGVLVYKPYRYGINNQFEGWRSPLDHEDIADSPTHWRPLPAPPSKEG